MKELLGIRNQILALKSHSIYPGSDFILCKLIQVGEVISKLPLYIPFYILKLCSSFSLPSPTPFSPLESSLSHTFFPEVKDWVQGPNEARTKPRLWSRRGKSSCHRRGSCIAEASWRWSYLPELLVSQKSLINFSPLYNSHPDRFPIAANTRAETVKM